MVVFRFPEFQLGREVNPRVSPSLRAMSMPAGQQCIQGSIKARIFCSAAAMTLKTKLGKFCLITAPTVDFDGERGLRNSGPSIHEVETPKHKSDSKVAWYRARSDDQTFAEPCQSESRSAPRHYRFLGHCVICPQSALDLPGLQQCSVIFH